MVRTGFRLAVFCCLAMGGTTLLAGGGNSYVFSICPPRDPDDCLLVASVTKSEGSIEELVAVEAALIDGFSMSVATEPDFLSPIDVRLASPFDDMETEFFALELESGGWAVSAIFAGPFQLEGPTAVVDVTYEVSGSSEFGSTTDFFFEDGAFGEPPIINSVTVGGELQDVMTLSGTFTFGIAPFVRGDANDDGIVNIADTIWILNMLFQQGAESSCMSAADANDDGMIDMGDAVTIVSYRFLGAPAPATPFPACGADSTPDELPCPEHSCL